ncbi:MAG: hypothetical protein IKN44_07175 [Bacteroidaceae bacterium]|nr:hypothetical protein [Bacteroidaceae bacterium]MBR3619513.1 hypothetical protein [Bacteroidaceae bacterium]
MAKKKIYCPKCGSVNCTCHRKGLNWKLGCLGFLLFNIFGLFLARIGHNRLICRCNNCGKKWEM